MSTHIWGNPARRSVLARVSFLAHSRVLGRLALPLAVMLASALLVVSPATPARAACANPVVCENQLTGTPQSTWDVTNPSTTIEGFADPFSVNVGGSINFKIKSPASSYTIHIYRMGYYCRARAPAATRLT